MTVIQFRSPLPSLSTRVETIKRDMEAPANERAFWRTYFGSHEKSIATLRNKHGQIIEQIWRSAVDDLGAEEAAKLFREFVK